MTPETKAAIDTLIKNGVLPSQLKKIIKQIGVKDDEVDAYLEKTTFSSIKLAASKRAALFQLGKPIITKL